MHEMQIVVEKQQRKKRRGFNYNAPGIGGFRSLVFGISTQHQQRHRRIGNAKTIKPERKPRIHQRCDDHCQTRKMQRPCQEYTSRLAPPAVKPRPFTAVKCRHGKRRPNDQASEQRIVETQQNAHWAGQPGPVATSQIKAFRIIIGVGQIFIAVMPQMQPFEAPVRYKQPKWQACQNFIARSMTGWMAVQRFVLQ